MNEQELKDYLKKNLKINVVCGMGFSKKIQLILDNEVISEYNLGIL